MSAGERALVGLFFFFFLPNSPFWVGRTLLKRVFLLSFLPPMRPHSRSHPPGFPGPFFFLAGAKHTTMAALGPAMGRLVFPPFSLGCSAVMFFSAWPGLMPTPCLGNNSVFL